MHHVHPMPFGASPLPGGGARFRLWAPAAHSVDLLLLAAGEVADELPAAAQGDGWYEVQHPAARAGQPYQWRIDGDLRVPDPASRHNPQGPHGPSVLVDPTTFDWNDGGWRGRPWLEAV